MRRRRRDGEAVHRNAEAASRTFETAVPESVERAVAQGDVDRRDRTLPDDRAMFAQALASGNLATPTNTATIPQPTVSAAKSVAVLPFANMSADPENEYFTDGMAEEIINALSKIQSLRVASRTSSFAFKGKNEDIGEIGRKLKVSTVLEGSVRKIGNKLRITAQLVNVADGYQLWSERYDREIEDVFAIQDDISQAIVKALRVILSEGEKKQIEQGRAVERRRRTTTTCAAGSTFTSSAARASSTRGRCSIARSRSIPSMRSRTPASPTAARSSTRISTRANRIFARLTLRAARRSSSSRISPKRMSRAVSPCRSAKRFDEAERAIRDGDEARSQSFRGSVLLWRGMHGTGAISRKQ